jgi:cysteinyl-tRNA synthetase
MLLLSACQFSGVPHSAGMQATSTHQSAATIAPGAILDIRDASQLADVSHWLYLIDVDLDEDIVDRIAASSYDMVVIDYIVSEEWNQDYPLSEVIGQWRHAAHPKLVLAYIDIGEAEDYRTYWQPGWRVGNPAWITGDDPDGWEGNYPVAYWHDAWREIWLGAQGYLQGILDAGYDGVYLDWVEAYSDENVLEIADLDGVDPIQEMIWFVTDLAAFGRDQDPGFIVVAQNAAGLAAYDEYVAVIDAIAQEQVWFDGGDETILPAIAPCRAPRQRSILPPIASRSPPRAAERTTNTRMARCTSAARNTCNPCRWRNPWG